MRKHIGYGSTIMTTELLRKARNIATALGSYSYLTLIIAVVVGFLWLAANLARVNTFAEIRPALAASLGSLEAFFGGADAVTASSISAPGQVIALNEFAVASRVSARLVSIAEQGDVVAEGNVVARFDDTNAEAALRSAETGLASARRELQEARSGATSGASPATDLETTLASTYDRGYTALSDTHINFAWIFAASNSVLDGKDIRESQANLYAYAGLISFYYPDIIGYRDRAAEDARRARNLYAAALAKYRGMSRGSSPEEIEAALDAAYDVSVANADALKSAIDFLAIVREKHEEAELSLPDALAGHEASLADALVTTNDSIDQLSFAIEAVRSGKAELSLAGAPAPASDTSATERALAEWEQAVDAARANLVRYEVHAPIAGTIADVKVPAGSAVVDGQIIATIMTSENVARVSISEADVAKVREGDSVQVSFDGVIGLSLPGTVLALDRVATVADGRVSFYAILGFNDADERVRPGMTVTAHISE